MVEEEYCSRYNYIEDISLTMSERIWPALVAVLFSGCLTFCLSIWHRMLVVVDVVVYFILFYLMEEKKKI